MTPFDKFPFDNNDKASAIGPQPIYNYLGLRDRTNRASPTTLLYRAVENLLARRDHGERSRIVEVFKLYGYGPTINLRMRLDVSEEVRNRIAHDAKWGPEQVGSTYYRVARAIERGDFDWDEFRAAIFLASDLAQEEQRKRYVNQDRFQQGLQSTSCQLGQMPEPSALRFDRLAAGVERSDGVRWI